MCQNKAKKPLFRSICSHVFRCLISIPEHMRSLFSERPRSATFPEHMRSVSVSNLLTCNLFRSICGHFLSRHGSATFFRSMCSHFSHVSVYLCGSFQYNKDSNSKDIMAGKTKDMSEVRKVLQRKRLHICVDLFTKTPHDIFCHGALSF